ncbi:MAG TPA: FtsX-like permease family protein [Vicinamibacterales bacterium]|nr:FtsX-like permease family protein [Vicinamibacterales bacterium]
MKFFPLVWRNLLRRKIRTTFTVLSVFVAFVLFGILMTIRIAFSAGVAIAGADRLMMMDKISLINPLPLSYQSRIAMTPGVVDVTHANWFGGVYQDPKNFFANMAVDPESWLRMYPEFQLPADQKKAWIADRTGAIVGIDTATRFGWKLGDRVPLLGVIYRRPDGAPWEFTIDGIYTSTEQAVDKTQFFFHWDYLNETLRNTAYGKDQVGWYVIRVKDPSQSDTLAKRLDAMFANSPNETKTATEKAFVSSFASQIGDIGSIMIAISIAVLFTILLVSGNTMAQAIRERTNELAILKTLGFGDGRILRLVLAESCVIALLGGVAGLAVSWALVTFGKNPALSMLPPFFLPIRDLVVGFAIVVALGLATGILPAVQASRMRIVDALRRNG